MAQSERRDLIASTFEVPIGVGKESGSPLLDGTCEGLFDLVFGAAVDNNDLQLETGVAVCAF